jgi:hypothetical protein
VNDPSDAAQQDGHVEVDDERKDHPRFVATAGAEGEAGAVE